MSKTQQELIVAALGKLNACGVGEAPSAEDVEKVRGYVEPRLAQLAADRVYYVPDVEEIDDEAFIPLSILIANAAASDFGQATDDKVDRAQEARLRSMNSIVPSRPFRNTYF
jgi:hypothetical protein